MGKTLAEAQASVTTAIAKYQPEIATVLGGSGPSFEVDWSSFEDCNNPDRVYNYLTCWDGYYTFGYAMYAIRECVNEYNGGEKLRALSKIVFKHNKNGTPRAERVTIEDNNMVINASCCCSWHWVYQSDMVLKLVIQYELFDGYITKINEAMPECSTKWANIPCETDWDTFEFAKHADTEFKAKSMKATALKNASSYSCYYSWRNVGWAYDCNWYGDDYTDEERTKAFGKIVLKCKMWRPAPAKVNYWWWDQSEVNYSVETKTLTIKSCFADDRFYWNYAGSWDIRRVVRQVLKLYRLGDFETMEEEAHEKKIAFLEDICTSWEVQRGDFEWLKKVINYPAFYPKDNHDRTAAQIVLDYINTPDYRKKGIMEDTLQAETESLEERGLAPDMPEELVGCWLVTKINWKGMQQDRLIVLTDRATYTCVPKYKGKANKKKIHRLSHEYYSYTQIGELKLKTGGAPTVSGGKMPNMPDVLPDVNAPKMPDMPDVNMPDVNMPGLPGMGGFRGPPYALKIYSSRLRKEEEPPKKAPKIQIPDLGAKICEMCTKMIDAIKDVEMPSLPKPSMPKMSCPDLLGLISKCKPSLPGGSAEAAPAATVYNENACAADLPADDSPMSSIEEGLKKAGVDGPDVDEPEPKVPDMLTKVLDKIKGITDFDFGLPDEFSLIGVLKSFMKTLGKMTGLDGLEAPKMPNLNPVDAIGKILAKLEGKVLPDMGSFPSLPDMLKSLQASAANLCPIDFPSPPKIPIKKILAQCIAVLSSIKLPALPFNPMDFFPGISLPNIKAPKMPKLPGGPDIKMPKVAMGESPVKNDYVEIIFKPILPAKIGGASKYVVYEAAWVISAAVRAYRRSWCSGVSHGDLNILTSFGGGLYNKFGRMLGKGVVSKPMGDGSAPEEDDDEDEDE